MMIKILTKCVREMPACVHTCQMRRGELAWKFSSYLGHWNILVDICFMSIFGLAPGVACNYDN